MANKKQYEKGHFIVLGLAIGIPAGIPAGLAIGNIAFGPLIGSIIGIITGIILERRKNKNPIKPDEETEAKMKKIYKIGFISGLLVLACFITIYFLIKSV
jgi:hypothetical protein